MDNLNVSTYGIPFIVTGDEDDNLIFYEDTSMIALNSVTITETKEFGGSCGPSTNSIRRN